MNGVRAHDRWAGLRRALLLMWAALMILPLTAAAPGVHAQAADAPAAYGVVLTRTAPADAYHATVVVLWNEAMLAAVRHGRPRPTVTARAQYMMHQAIYDAWSLYDPVAVPTLLDPQLRRPAELHTDANKAAAISQAAYTLSVALFPEYEAKTRCFSRLLDILGYEPDPSIDLTTPAGIGYAAAQAVLADRADDGSNAANDYADVTSDYYPELYQPLNSGDPLAANGVLGAAFSPNHWEPLRVPTGAVKDEYGTATVDPANPASFREQVYLTPHWGAVRPFALAAGDQFRPPAPPQLGSDTPYTDGLGRTMTNDAAFRLQVDEIVQLNANLTDELKVVAEYWADGPRSETPPGHWNAIAHGIAFRDRHTIDDDVKLFFALNGALFDASIAAWEAKRAYDFVRPITAIHYLYAGQMIEAWAGPDRGTQVIPAAQWLPYQDTTFVTPAFAEYVSGHSSYSAAAAVVLTEFTGSNRFYDGKTLLYDEDFNRDGLPDLLGQHVIGVGDNMFESSPTQTVILQWETFQEAANEAGLSRRYGGIHFLDADLRGRELGRNVGVQAYDHAAQFWDGSAAR